MKRMVIDTANILFRVAAAHGRYNAKDLNPQDSAGLAMHTALRTLNKLFKQHKPDQIAVTFEGRNNWRKEYTKSAKCLSGKVYKANRVKDPSMEPFFELIKSFEELARQHTTLICLSNDNLEGDDLFAAYVAKYTALGDEVIGVSGDKDFIQLYKHPNFTLINPDKGKARTVQEVCGDDISDAEYFMFEKAIRGDKGDNVFSAYPRVRHDKIKKAYSDEYFRTNFMNETWEVKDSENLDEDGNPKSVTYRVGDLFEENMLLMNLEGQPEYIKTIITETLEHELKNHGKFSLFYFTKFCAKFGLKQIAEDATSFAQMFNIIEGEKVLKSQEQRKKELLSF